MQLKIRIILMVMSASLLSGGTPIEFGISLTGGYDNNAMRFSTEEINEAANEIGMMGGAKTFDSFITKWGASAMKEIIIGQKKEMKFKGFFYSSDYRNTPDKKYWSGGTDLTYKWGSYKSIKYSLRHLDKFYLRHYVNRDVALADLASCLFTDRNHALTVTHRLSKFSWINVGAGYLQRYYAKPFTEFDLDIVYLKAKLNYRLKNIGSVAVQINQGVASNISYSSQIRPSSFDRSYETMELYFPFKINKKLVIVNEIGVSLRAEFRAYDAEDSNDPLHSGRSHVDSKYDMWIKKKLTDEVSFTLSSRFRTRSTESEYEWVDDLKSFKQFQFWFNIEWDMIYDKY